VPQVSRAAEHVGGGFVQYGPDDVGVCDVDRVVGEIVEWVSAGRWIGIAESGVDEGEQGRGGVGFQRSVRSRDIREQREWVLSRRERWGA